MHVRVLSVLSPSTVTSCPPPPQRALQSYVTDVSEKAPAMMYNKKARIVLLRFFAPTQVGDKGPSGELPFDLGELIDS